MRKSLIILCVLIFGVLSFVLVYEMVLKNAVKKLGVIPQNIVEVVEMDENIEFRVTVYMTNSFSKMFLARTIDTIYLEDVYQAVNVDLIEIKDVEASVEHSGLKYHMYSLTFRLDSEEEPVLWKFEEASLRFVYLDGQEISFQVGYLWLEKSDKLDMYNADLKITRLRGFSKIESTGQTLGGLVIGIRNDTEVEVMIENILPKHDWIRLVYEDKRSIIKGLPIQETNVDMFLGYNLNLNQTIENGDLNLSLQPKEEIQYFFPLNYSQSILISKLGLELYYVKQGIDHQMDKAPFLFFLETRENMSNVLDMQTYKWIEFK